jgi:transposase
MFRPWEPPASNPSSGDVSLQQRKKRFLSKDAQDVVISVYNTLLNRMGKKNLIKETSTFTSVPERTVKRIVSSLSSGPRYLPRKRVKDSFKKIDNFTEEVVKRTVYDFYRKNEVATLTEIHQALLASEVGFPYSETTLWRLLRKLGFKYGKLNERRIIMETSRLKKLREEFITNIRLKRSAGKSIVYLDETWFDTHDTLKKGYRDDSQNCATNTPCSRGKRLIILHAGTENGWIQGALLVSSKHLKNSSADYHEDMCSELFEKWFVEQLLPNIPANSVIVMDNASYHSRQEEKIPNTNSRKPDIVAFLRKRHISIPEKITVKKLLEIVQSQKFEKKYFIDKITAEAGHEILRLPPYYCVLNPIELMWSYVKKQIRKTNITPTVGDSVIQNLRTVVDMTNPTLWKNACEHVIKVENEFLAHPVYPVIINTCETSSSEEYTSESE